MSVAEVSYKYIIYMNYKQINDIALIFKALHASYNYLFFTHLKLCIAAATHNYVKCVKILTFLKFHTKHMHMYEINLVGQCGEFSF